MGLNSEHRAQYLRFLAQDCSVNDLKQLRSDIEAELSRRISAKLVLLIPGQHVRFATDLTKSGEIGKWDVGTLLRIHRRSLVVQKLSGKEESVNGERFIEAVSEDEWQRLRMQQNLGPAAAEAQTALAEAAAPPELFAGLPPSPDLLLDPRVAELPDEVV